MTSKGPDLAVGLLSFSIHLVICQAWAVWTGTSSLVYNMQFETCWGPAWAVGPPIKVAVAFWISHFHGLYLGFIFFIFSLINSFSCLLIFLLRHTLFTFFNCLLLSQKWNLSSMEGEHFWHFHCQSWEMKTYWYRRLTSLRSSSNIFITKEATVQDIVTLGVSLQVV